MLTLNSLLTIVLRSKVSYMLLFMAALFVIAQPVKAVTAVRQNDSCVRAPSRPEESILGDTFDMLDKTVWSTDPTSHFAPFVLCGDNVLKAVGIPEGAWRGKLFYNRAMVSGDTVTIDFKLDALNSKANFDVENGSDGTANRFGIEADQGKIYIKIFTGTFLFPGALITPTRLDTWYELTLAVDDIKGFSVKLRDTDSDVTATYTRKMPKGMKWNFAHYLIEGNAYLDNFAQSGQALAISGIPDQRIDEDAATGPIPFRIGNFGPITTAVTVTLQSPDSGPLFPSGSAVLGGSGLQRTIAITPAANQSGSATFTLTLSTDTDTTERAFNVYVNSVNDVPTISPISYTNAGRVPGGEPVGPLPFVIGDVDNSVISLTVNVTTSNLAVLPLENIRFAGSGPNRTITVIPSALTSGDVTVTLTVSDAIGSSNTSFHISSFSRRFTPIVYGPAIPPSCETQAVDCFEPNNGFNSATPITVPRSLSATLNGSVDQRDYFSVNLVAGHTYTVTMLFPIGDLDLYLYTDGEPFKPVAISDQTDTRFEQIVYTPQQDGRFFILAFNYLDPKVPQLGLLQYSLTVTGK